MSKTLTKRQLSKREFKRFKRMFIKEEFEGHNKNLIIKGKRVTLKEQEKKSLRRVRKFLKSNSLNQKTPPHRLIRFRRRFFPSSFLEPQKSDILIRRENVRGKFFMTARLKGKILTRRKWSTKKEIGVTKEQAIRIFKSNRSFNLKKNVVKLTNFNEISDFSIQRPPSHIKKYQFVIRGVLSDGRQVVAVSMQHNIDFPVNKAKREAQENFNVRFHQEIEGGYDEDTGMELVEGFKEAKLLRVEEGIKYYTVI